MLKPLSFSLVCVCVCVCLFLKKRMGNCPTLFEKVYCMQYNLPHPPLKVTMAFKWSCGVLLCQNLFSSPLCVCVFASQEKKKNAYHILTLALHNQVHNYFFSNNNNNNKRFTTSISRVFSLEIIFFSILYIVVCIFFFSFWEKLQFVLFYFRNKSEDLLIRKQAFQPNLFVWIKSN